MIVTQVKVDNKTYEMHIS